MSKIENDNVNDFRNFLSTDDEGGDPNAEAIITDPNEEGIVTNEEVVEEEEKSEVTTDDASEEPTDDDESEEQESEDPLEKKDVTFSQIKSKYPDLFKDFPELRHRFFHAKEYREIFPTVEDAKEAAQDIENLRGLESAISKGSVEDITGVIKSFESLGDGTAEKFASNFLPAIRNINQDVYFKVITQPLVDFTRGLYEAGLRSENDNFKNAALVAAQHFFGDPKVATGEKQVKTSKEEPQKNDELDKERKAFMAERYTSLLNDVTQESNSQLETLVLDGLDPKDEMSEGMKEMLAEKITKEIGTTLLKSNVHKQRMNAVWIKAKDNNFAASNRKDIVNAYLESAKEILPKIRSSLRAKALGIRERHPNRNGRKVVDKKEPTQGPSGGSGKRQSVTSKNVDWKKTSDIDVFNDNVTFKG